MTGNDEALSLRAIELARQHFRKLADDCAASGISAEDIAVASMYATFDIAEQAKGPAGVAIEWCRSALDVMEASLIAGAQRQ